MSESVIGDQFYRAQLFITEGQVENALAVLDQVQPENLEQKREVAYLRAWGCTVRDHWDEAAQFLLAADISDELVTDIQSLGQTERRRRAHYLLLMGNIAVNIGRLEEAIRHYTQCIKFLDERRMNVVDVRIRARCGLGTAFTITGFYSVAVTHYEDALRLCGEGTAHPNLPDIYYGLCDAYRHLGNFERALACGKKALQLYTERTDKGMAGRMRNLLGRICYHLGDFQAASAYYTEALALAMRTNSMSMTLINFSALADLRREEGQLEEAWRYCELALDYAEQVPSKHIIGMMYIICGKVIQAQAEKAEGQESRELAEKAISYYQNAVEVLEPTDAKVELSEAHGRLAQLLETSGRQNQAIAHWKLAYSASSGPEDSPFF